MNSLLVVVLFLCYVNSISSSISSITNINKITNTSITAPVLSQSQALPSGSPSYKICIVSWNLAEKSPSEIDFLNDFRSNDIIVFGVQELEDIRPRRSEGRRSKLLKKLQKQVLGKSFVCINRSKLGGIQSSVYVKKSLAKKIQDIQIIYVACGIGNVIVNKGAVCTLLKINSRSICIINSHLAAHQHMLDARNADYARIMGTVREKTRPSFLKSDLVAATSKRMHNKVREYL